MKTTENKIFPVIMVDKDIVGWHPRKIAFFTTMGLCLSILSSLDCDFVAIDVGFNPVNSMFNASEYPISVGLWTYESPVARKQCLTYRSASKLNVLSNDESYKEMIYNGHGAWSLSRVFAILSFVFGTITCVLTWYYAIWGSKNPSNWLALTITGLTLVSEVCKFAYFFKIHLCTGKEWQIDSTDATIIDKDQKFTPFFNALRAADCCYPSRGSWASAISFSSYFVNFTLLLYYVLASLRGTNELPSISVILGERKSIFDRGRGYNYNQLNPIKTLQESARYIRTQAVPKLTSNKMEMARRGSDLTTRKTSDLTIMSHQL